MIRWLVGRTGRALLALAAIVTATFFMARLSGDPTALLLPDDAPEEARAAMRESLGLHRPLLEQFGDYLMGLIQGDAGTSYQYHRPVVELFLERLPYTASLGLLSLLLATLMGIPLGMLAAARRGSAADRGTMALAVLGDTVPDFVQGILLIFVGALVLGMLPSGGAASPLSYVLPTITLSLGIMGALARWTRASVLDELSKDYLDTARAKGASERRVIVRHAGRNALIPVVTIIGMQLGALIGGTVVVETVFAWPGIGTLFTTAAQVRDFPVIQFGVIAVAALVLLSTLLVDLSYAVLDPRIRIHGR